ncbi:TetR/AcrR family transcriptional regulator [Nocardia vinacea]|uniref:TetR/AcrR family transcriptional regulator n=1 Tax=Nocardia vinacea TaxID=96468 RepID=UPI00343C7AE1
MARRTETRARILDTGAQFFRTRGYSSTGLKELVTASGAPWGSLYHYFPGGKEQLGVEAIKHSGRRFEHLIDTAFEQAGGDPVVGLRNFFQLSATALEESDYADGCPIGTVALETASTSEPLRAACADTFTAWQLRIREILGDSGLPEDQARALATVVLATFEGALMLSRTHRTTQPLHDGADAMAPLISAHISASNRESYRRAIRRPPS